jgi:hypothetical protein
LNIYTSFQVCAGNNDRSRRNYFLSRIFCFIESESFPVGIFTLVDCKIKQLSTAAYKRASRLRLQAHIQLADNDIPSKPSLIGAQTMFDSASAIAVLLLQQDSMLQLENVPSKLQHLLSVVI